MDFTVVFSSFESRLGFGNVTKPLGFGRFKPEETVILCGFSPKISGFDRIVQWLQKLGRIFPGKSSPHSHEVLGTEHHRPEPFV